MADTLLEDRLRALGRAMEFPSESTLADEVLAELDQADPARSPWRRPLLIAAALVLVVTAALVAVPGSRSTIARWLGFDELRIERVDVVPPTVSVPGTASGLTLDQAAARVGVTPLVAPGLGPVRAIETPLEEYVVVRYDQASVVTLPGSVDGGTFRKLGTAGVDVQPVALFGGTAYWISGDPHVFAYVDDDGQVREARPAADTLVWQRGDVIARVEGDVTLERAIEIARSVREP